MNIFECLCGQRALPALPCGGAAPHASETFCDAEPSALLSSRANEGARGPRTQSLYSDSKSCRKVTWAQLQDTPNRNYSTRPWREGTGRPAATRRKRRHLLWEPTPRGPTARTEMEKLDRSPAQMQAAEPSNVRGSCKSEHESSTTMVARMARRPGSLHIGGVRGPRTSTSSAESSAIFEGVSHPANPGWLYECNPCLSKALRCCLALRLGLRNVILWFWFLLTRQLLSISCPACKPVCGLQAQACRTKGPARTPPRSLRTCNRL